MAVTPQAGNASQVVTGGTPVVAVLGVPAGINGGFITNPVTPTDQGISGSPEPLYVNVVTTASLAGNGTTFALSPGQTFNLVPGQTTAASVNAQTTGHRFTVIWW